VRLSFDESGHTQVTKMQGFFAALPSPLPIDPSYLLSPRYPPFVGPWFEPDVDPDLAASMEPQRLMWQGLPLPAQEYGEEYTPHWSHWWPPSIMRLYHDTSTEEVDLKLRFYRLFPVYPLHPHRTAETEQFQQQSRFLNAKLGRSTFPLP
jgi:hypothetical protein